VGTEAPAQPEATEVQGNTAVVVFAANLATDGAILYELGAGTRATLLAPWLALRAEAFAAALGAVSEPFEYALVPSSPESADAAIELLLVRGLLWSESNFSEVVLYTRDQGLQLSVQQIVDALPSRVREPMWAWNKPWSRRPLSQRRRHNGWLPPVADPLRCQYTGPTESAVAGVVRMGQLLAGNKATRVEDHEEFVERPPRNAVLGVEPTGMAGVWQHGSTHVVESRLPLVVLRKLTAAYWLGVDPRAHRLHDSATLAGVPGVCAGVIGVVIRIDEGGIIGEILRVQFRFATDWWVIPYVDDDGVFHTGATAKYRVKCPPQASFEPEMVPAVAVVERARGEVWWIAAPDVYHQESNGIALSRGLCATANRVVLSGSFEIAYAGAFVPIQAPGVADAVEKWNLGLNVDDLLPLPLVVPANQLPEDLVKQLTPAWCPSPVGPSVMPAEAGTP
jgi:hypothetical protein